ncbi:MAG: hypothetical protein EVA29_02440 [Candidatus Actinomarinales bacterium]|nr:MAG: hypothetical protein EVA29_02440 [Candidatus Actinomarinales bacterium]
MDEKLVEEISNSTGVPQELVSRSAQARAEANGVDINNILSSWSSGEIVATTPQVDSPEAVEEEVLVSETVEEEVLVSEAVEEEVLVSEAVEGEVLVSEAVVDTIEEVGPPVNLSTKIIKTIQYGSLFGVVSGFIQAFILSSNLYDGLVLESETLKLIANYEQSRYILNLALTTTFFGVINAVNIKKILDTNFEGFGIKTSDTESVFLGLGLGLMFGSSSGFLITSSIGQVIEGILPEDPTTYLIPVFGSFWRVVFLGIFSQSLIALITMILGVPKGLDVYEQGEADIIRKRITGSIVVPFGAIISGGIVSVFISQVFINFHDYAVLFALIISATILLFASIMSSAPKIKITRNEVLIAGLGILTLIVIIVSVAASQH